MIKDESRPNFVLFLTDGLPTVGETNEAKIAANAKQHNKLRDADVSTLASATTSTAGCWIGCRRDNFGQSEYVRPDENIEAHVSSVYNKLGAPVMTNVAVKVDVEGAIGERRASAGVYPKEFTTCLPASSS